MVAANVSWYSRMVGTILVVEAKIRWVAARRH